METKNNKIIKIAKDIFRRYKALILGLVAMCLILFFIANFTILYFINPKTMIKQVNNHFINIFEKYNNNYNYTQKKAGIKIEGHIYFKAFPKRVLTLTNVKLYNIYYKNNFINADIRSIDLEVDLIPIFFKKINVNNVKINSMTLNVATNENLLNEYKKIVKTKKLVEIDKNEISGIGNKLKEILMVDDNSDIPDGYKEITVEEEKSFSIDNTNVENMAIDLIKEAKISQKSSIKNINFNNANIYIYDKDNLIKTLTNINLISDVSNNKININSNLILEKENIFFDLSFRNKNDNYDFYISSKSNVYDNFEMNLNIETNDPKDILTWKGQGKINLNILSLADFTRIFTFGNLQLYKKIINNDKIKIKNSCKFDNGLIKCDDISIDSNNLKLNSNLLYDGTINITNNIKIINYDAFFIKSVPEKNTNITKENIFIFNSKNIDELMKKINKNKKIPVDFNIKTKIDTLTFNSESFKDNVIDFQILNNKIKIEKVDINNKNMHILIDNPTEKNDGFVHKITIEGNNIHSLLYLLSMNNKYLKDSNFKMTSDFVVDYNKFILYNSNFTFDDLTAKINAEYNPSSTNGYFAMDLKMDNIGYEEFITKFNVKKNKTEELPNNNNLILVKEKVLLLNNLVNNLYLKFSFNNIKYKNYDNMRINGFAKINKGYINLELENANLFNIKNLKGNVIYDLNTDITSQMFVDLSIDNINLNLYLLPYMIDIDKYTKIFIKTEDTNEDAIKIKNNRFWVDKLFNNVPLFNEIYGKINILIKNGTINDIKFNNFDFKTTVEDGTFYINNLLFDGFGGNTNISGHFVLKKEKAFNLFFKKTIYNLEDMQKLFFKDNSYIKGKIGFGGFFKANGENKYTFTENIDIHLEFLTSMLYVKNLGLRDLQSKLSMVYKDKNLISQINPKDILIKTNSGTIFNQIKGNLFLQNKITNLSFVADGDGISGKTFLIVNNKDDNNSIIDFLNTFIFYIDINTKKIPLYTYISFKEDLQNKALLDVNTKQIDAYLSEVEKAYEKVEMENKKNKVEFDFNNIDDSNIDKNLSNNNQNINENLNENETENN